jgi:hypothetical protein
MTDLDDIYHLRRVVNLGDDTVIALTYAVPVLPGEFLMTWRPRIAAPEIAIESR